jgi:hypothetical protein
MRDAVRAFASYGGRRVQTRYFSGHDPEWLALNISAARALVDDAVRVDEARVERKADGTILLFNISSASVLRFLRGYAFHERSFDLDPDLVTRYIESQNEKGRLGRWNVALMSGAADATEGTFSFGHGLVVTKLRRSKLLEATNEFDDIKTLMSKEDRVVDLPEIDQTTARKLTERALADARGVDNAGLLALYPIDRTSPPDPANEKTRVPLNAVDDMIGVGLVFPGTGAEDAVEYMSADLSKLGLTVDDVEISEDEDPDADELEAA